MQTFEWRREEATCLEGNGSSQEEDNNVVLETEIQGGDFSHAGAGSSELKNTMKKLGIPHKIVKRTAVSAYEAEMNVVIHSEEGKMITKINRDKVKIEVEDRGKGIPDIEKALQPGYSTASEEIREMGFGAGLGFSNIKNNTDKLLIRSEPEQGTYVEIVVCLS